MVDPKEIKASQIRLSYPEKLVDRWLEAGYRSWLKRQNPKKSLTKVRQVNEQLKQLDKSQLKRLINQIKS